MKLYRWVELWKRLVEPRPAAKSMSGLVQWQRWMGSGEAKKVQGEAVEVFNGGG
jgi:hypothetical protein